MAHNIMYYANVFKCNSILISLITDPHPRNIALAHMPEALGFIDIVMEFSFNNCLKILLHLPAGNIYYNSQRHYSAFFISFLYISTYYGYFAVFDFIKFFCPHPFKGRRALSAELNEHVFLPDSLTLKCRAV